MLPSGATTTVTSVDTLGDGPEEAVPPLSVSFTLADQLDVGRGDMVVGLDDQPTAARELD